MIKPFAFLLLLFYVVSFSQKKEILKVMTDQQTAWNNGNIDGYMQGYWKNDSLLFIGSKGPTYGWQKTLDNYKKSYPNKEKMGILEFSDIQVKILGKKHAYVFGKWKLVRTNDSPNGIYTLIFQKFKNGWKIISDHTN
jgi:ketosteroid isomerase-like protein